MIDTSMLTDTQLADLARARRSARWVGLILPLILVGAGTLLLVWWMPRVPNPAATHWGFSGGPDGFGPAVTYPWLLLGVGGGVIALFWFMIYSSGRALATPVWSSFQRFMAAFSAGFAVFMTLLSVGLVAIQLDLHDAAQAPGVGFLMLIAFAGWIGVTLAAWFAQPAVNIRRALGAAAKPAVGADGEPVPTEWVGLLRPSKVLVGVLGSTTVLLVVMTVWMFSLDAIGGWITLGTTLLVLVAGMLASWYWVRIDESGLEARAPYGWPVFRVPAADVERVEVTRIDPLGEFGGWGVRWMPGRFGLVMRSGEGIVITRRGGRIFAATVDDAEQAAAVLAAVALAAGNAGNAGNAGSLGEAGDSK